MATRKGTPYITVEHRGGKEHVRDHPSKKAAHSFGMSLRRAGKVAFAHSKETADKHGLDPRAKAAPVRRARGARRRASVSSAPKAVSSEKSGVRPALKAHKPAAVAKPAGKVSVLPPKPPKPASQSPQRSHTPVKKLAAPKFANQSKSAVKAPAGTGKKVTKVKGKVTPGLTPKEPTRKFASKAKVSTGKRFGKIAKKGPAQPKGTIKQSKAQRKFAPARKPGLLSRIKALATKKIDARGTVQKVKAALTKKRSIGGNSTAGVKVGKKGGRFKFSPSGKKIYLHRK